MDLMLFAGHDGPDQHARLCSLIRAVFIESIDYGSQSHRNVISDMCAQ